MKIDIFQHLFGTKDRIEVTEYRPVFKAKNISKSGFLCSACSFGDFDGFHEYKPNYCPNCGAVIVRPEEDIVHCGECKHYGIDCNLLTALPTESDYCSWGER